MSLVVVLDSHQLIEDEVDDFWSIPKRQIMRTAQAIRLKLTDK